MDNVIDGLEVFVKVKIGISLTKEEREIFDNYDDEEKKIIFDFINNPAFSDNLNRIKKKIFSKDEKSKCK